MQEGLRRHRGISRRAVMLHVAVLGSEAITDVPAPVQNVLVAPRSSSVRCDNNGRLPTSTVPSFCQVRARAPGTVSSFPCAPSLPGGRLYVRPARARAACACKLGCALGEALSTPTAA